MGAVYCLMGKSASGKDTIYQRLLEETTLRPVVLYTTRPIREGEVNGVTYHFVDGETLSSFEKEHKLIEKRTYQTVKGPWTYATVKDASFDPDLEDYLLIGTLDVYRSLRTYFGETKVIPLYIEVPDTIRKERAMKRESEQKKPDYRELERRFAADAKDFSEENLAECGIKKRFDNTELEPCLRELKQYLISKDK